MLRSSREVKLSSAVREETVGEITISEDIAAIWQAFSGLRGKTDRGKNVSKHGPRCFLESEKYGEGAYIDSSEHCNQGLSTGHQGSGRRHLTVLT